MADKVQRGDDSEGEKAFDGGSQWGTGVGEEESHPGGSGIKWS